MKFTLNFIFICLLVSCGKQESKSTIKNFKVSSQSYQSYINESSVKQHDLQKDIYIANQEYPIEISLYKDGSFYYNLPNLGDGQGNWQFKNGRIKLFAERNLFDMHIDIFSRNKNATELAITFSDRFGPKVLPVEIYNN